MEDQTIKRLEPTEKELNLECLKLALQSSPTNNVDMILENAEKYKLFILKTTTSSCLKAPCRHLDQLSEESLKALAAQLSQPFREILPILEKQWESFRAEKLGND